MNKLLNHKSALIIQGLIMSRGKTGKHFGNPNLEVENIFFDCTNTINEIIHKYADIYDLIIISTWETENTSGIIESKKVKIIKSKIPSFKVRNLNEPNTLNQFYGIQEGLRHAKSHNCELVVKIRTDTSVDVSSILKLLKSLPNKLWVVPFSAPNCISDFFIAGNINNMLTLTKLILKTNYYSKLVHQKRSIHYRIFYQYVYTKSPFFKKIQFWKYGNSIYYLTPVRAKVIKLAWENYFSPIPQEIFNSIKWRGFRAPAEAQHTDDELLLKFSKWVDTQIANSKNPLKRYYFLLSLIGKFKNLLLKKIKLGSGRNI